MSDKPASRDSELALLGTLKRAISLQKPDLERIDSALVSRWGIDFISTRATLLEYLEQLPPGQARDLGLTAFHADLGAGKGRPGEQNMYAAMAHPELCGIVTSSRRHYLLDAIALACALYRRLNLTGPVLDVGCHIGVAPDLMAETLKVPVVGLEPVPAVVKAATERLEHRNDVSIVLGAVPWQTDAKFDLVTAIDAMPVNAGDRSLFLKGLSQVLQPGGVALVVSGHWIHADVAVLRRQLAAASLGYGFADVVGGYGGMPNVFGVEGCVCLIKGGTRQFPRKVGAEMESEWAWFKAYANAPTTPEREKTQSFMRSQLEGA